MSQNLSQGQIIPPTALRLSGVINGAIAALRARFGLYLGLGALPAIVGLIGVLILAVVTAVIVAIVIGTGNVDGIGPGAVVLIVIGAVALFVALVAFMLFTYRVQGMIALLTNDLCHGRDSNFAGLWDRTRGLIGRVLGLVLLLAAIIFLIFGVFAALITAAILAAAAGINSGDSSGTGAAAAAVSGVVLLTVLIYPAIGVAALIVAIRLYVLLPVLSIEELGGFDAVRRTWRLTKGFFFRTLGYFLLIVLIVSAINWMLQIPFTAVNSLSSAPSGADASSATGMMAFLVPLLLLAYLPILLFSLLATPATMAYNTIYYIDLVRRQDYGMVTPVAGAPGAPYGAMPYGQAPQNYPAQNPGPGYSPQGGYPPQNLGPGYPPQNYPAQGGYPPQNPPPQDYR